jgi:hypothetical protein
MATKTKIDGFTNYHVRVGRAVAVHTDQGTVSGIVKSRDNDKVIVNCMGTDQLFDLKTVVAVWNNHQIEAIVAWAHVELKRQRGINAPTSHEIQEFLDRNDRAGNDEQAPRK